MAAKSGVLYITLMDPGVTAALVGVAATAAGWLVLYRLDQLREERQRRLVKRLEYSTRQIEEFYGPLFNLAHQLFLANEVQEALLNAVDAQKNKKLNEEQAEVVRSFFQAQHFLPVHQAINEVLKSKLHLVRGTEIPKSFYAYLRHALQERNQRLLWSEKGIDSSFLKGVPWPRHFYSDLQSGLAEVMAEYEEALSGLTQRRNKPTHDGGKPK